MNSIPEDVLERLSEAVHRHLGLNYPRDRWSDLARGVEATCREMGESSAEACARRLASAPLERRHVESLGRHLTIGETYFFREKEAFRTMEEQILPDLLEKRRSEGRLLRLWSAGCATGEEIYSLAILLRRAVPDLERWKVDLRGTDINTEFLRRADQGIYGLWSFRTNEESLRQRWFSPIEETRYRIRPEIRQMVTFSYLNLADDPYPSLDNGTNAMDIIFCRNVLLYFSPQMRQRVLEGLARCLKDGGVLVLGAAETAIIPPKGLTPLSRPGTIYLHKTEPPPPLRPTLPKMPSPSLPRPLAPSAAPSSHPDFGEALRTAYRKGDFAGVCRRANSLRESDPEFPAAALLVARSCANEGHLEDALSWCDAALGRSRIQPEAHYLRAMILNEIGRIEEAMDSLRTTLYLDPSFIPAFVALGNIARRQGETRTAERNFRNALILLESFEDEDVVPHSDETRAGRLREAVIAAMEMG